MLYILVLGFSFASLFWRLFITEQMNACHVIRQGHWILGRPGLYQVMKLKSKRFESLGDGDHPKQKRADIRPRDVLRNTADFFH
ncbi:hypothetical protein EDD85DRAFT_863975 [Armillaria nabsnona]|nr:hypothetical protein EDD85DRAFT_863975 [Armillaria nabsnona]